MLVLHDITLLQMLSSSAYGRCPDTIVLDAKTRTGIALWVRAHDATMPDGPAVAAMTMISCCDIAGDEAIIAPRPAVGWPMCVRRIADSPAPWRVGPRHERTHYRSVHDRHGHVVMRLLDHGPPSEIMARGLWSPAPVVIGAPRDELCDAAITTVSGITGADERDVTWYRMPDSAVAIVGHVRVRIWVPYSAPAAPQASRGEQQPPDEISRRP